jgi:hypothetical protein
MGKCIFAVKCTLLLSRKSELNSGGNADKDQLGHITEHFISFWFLHWQNKFMKQLITFTLA